MPDTLLTPNPMIPKRCSEGDESPGVQSKVRRNVQLAKVQSSLPLYRRRTLDILDETPMCAYRP